MEVAGSARLRRVPLGLDDVPHIVEMLPGPLGTGTHVVSAELDRDECVVLLRGRHGDTSYRFGVSAALAYVTEEPADESTARAALGIATLLEEIYLASPPAPGASIRLDSLLE